MGQSGYDSTFTHLPLITPLCSDQTAYILHPFHQFSIMAELFSPSCPIPFILQPEVRIQQLKKALETEIGQIQRVNIEALIRMYESGEIGPRQIGDPPIYLAGGKLVDHDPWKDPSLTPGPVKWREQIYTQFAQQNGSFELQQMPQSLAGSFHYSPTTNMHELHARIRLPL